jgi:hypothetical protein
VARNPSWGHSIDRIMMILKQACSLHSSKLLVLLSVCFLISTTEVAADEWLITPLEAQMQIRNGSYAEPVAAIEGLGPEIILRNPTMFKKLRSPIDIFIAFEPGKSGKRADMGTLEVILIGFININITDRLREYIRGNNLDVEKAKLPDGEHRLRMGIRDIDGNINQRDVVVTVLSG